MSLACRNRHASRVRSTYFVVFAVGADVVIVVVVVVAAAAAELLAHLRWPGTLPWRLWCLTSLASLATLIRQNMNQIHQFGTPFCKVEAANKCDA